ncbi:hypothetical protein [Ponticaulis sp.]|uniref:hypothetical protein n=1 Tax=Ponticaulis sp. TaxID=2020902 RepID=UPI000B674CD7|nr:hypothetical protein [Ponticaulis sp.]MAJ07900.1 hypothetical protein [Ponticaulis sp.]RPG18212.1 MAG: hypothetical protein CBC85_002995 [Hyphomonadaceae bacterium TMED125]HBH89503.1 hypothetical protein [Hyphomonadaceae bacterium]|tara:strand:- start:296 stop:919 length:624 start_codon:yes stop_codon:yes gene_type:complete
MNSKLADDLEYVRTIAEAGEDAPPIAGRFATLWFLLVTAALLAHWALAKGFFAGADERWAGAVWMAMGISGGIGSFILGKTAADLPGQSAPVNRVDRSTWRVASFGLFAFAISIVVAVSVRPELSVDLFDAIMPAAFLVYGISYAATAAFSKDRGKWLPVIVSVAFACLTIGMFGLSDTYLAAAIGTLLCWLTGGARQLLNEPKSVV